jgi:hypothetical protein
MSQIPDGAKVVFADVRFPNEANIIKKLGGTVVRINRDGNQAANQHISETALDNFDFDHYLDNNGSIEELHESLKTNDIL